jgi:high-affinity iron transporter
MLARRITPFNFRNLAIKATLFLITSFFLTGYSTASPAEDNAKLRQLAQLAEYIGVDYSAAVDMGQVVNAGEYQEMVEFSDLLVNRIVSKQGVLKGNEAIANQALKLQQTIQNKGNVSDIRKLSANLRGSLLKLMPQLSFPQQLLPEAEVNRLFQENCSACHGISGEGNGPLAAQLEPQPTDFTNKERANNRSILGLYDAISNGINETAMPSFAQLAEQQRWSLAFYAGKLAFQSDQRPVTEGLTLPLQEMINYSPAQLMAKMPSENNFLVEWFRANPERLFVEQQKPLAITRKQLKLALEENRKENYSQAANLAVSAYLDGFELVENSLDAHDTELRKSMEANMMNLRQLLSHSQKSDELDEAMTTILHQLDEAERLLEGSVLSGGTLFTASLVILLREGLEALLVVIALMTVLVKTDRKDALKYVHLGWISALIAGGATWVAAQSLITISGANREVMEGVAALLAALVLLYVGIWMHSKTHADHWQAYIQKHINANLKAGTLWGLAALAFVAVYREVFETVLFYEALLTQAVTTQYFQVAGGFMMGTVLLLILAWLLIRYSVKLPISKFFASTTYLLLALSFVLMGKAVIALQEAAVIGISPLPVYFEFDWIGVKSTWQGLFAQALILFVFILFILQSKLRQKSQQKIAL